MGEQFAAFEEVTKQLREESEDTKARLATLEKLGVRPEAGGAHDDGGREEAQDGQAFRRGAVSVVFCCFPATDGGGSRLVRSQSPGGMGSFDHRPGRRERVS